MEQQSTLEVVIEILTDDLGVEEGLITENARLQDDLELDSTDTVEIAQQLMKRFGIELKLQVRDDPTVAEVCAKIDEARAEQQNSGSSLP